MKFIAFAALLSDKSVDSICKAAVFGALVAAIVFLNRD